MKKTFSNKIIKIININFIIYSISLILSAYLVSYYIINVYIMNNLDTIFNTKKYFMKNIQETINSEFLMYKKYGIKNFKLIDSIYGNGKFEFHNKTINFIPHKGIIKDKDDQYIYFSYNYNTKYLIGINLNKIVKYLNIKNKANDFIVILKTSEGFVLPQNIIFNSLINKNLNEDTIVLKTKTERYNVKLGKEYGIDFFVLINSKIIDTYTTYIAIAAFTFLLIIIIINKTNSIFVQRSIEKPINTLITGIKNIKTKKSSEIIYEEDDEFKILSNEFNALYKQLRVTILDLKQSEENAKKASEFKSNVLKTLSHEIKTPLHSILGFTEYLKLKLNDEKDIEILNTVRKSSSDLLKKFEKLFERSKIETEPENIKLNLENFNLKTTILKIASIYESECSKKNIKFNLSFKLENLNTQFLDKIKIEKVLIELLDNALKFTEKGEINFTIENDEKNLYFSIEDTGKGIKADEIDIIFEDFFQSEHFLTRTTEGMGMGLSISNFYIKVMDGKIKFKSKKIGTIVNLEIPTELTLKKIKNLSIEKDFKNLSISKKKLENIQLNLEKDIREIINTTNLKLFKEKLNTLYTYTKSNNLNTLSNILFDLKNKSMGFSKEYLEELHNLFLYKIF
ncbi:hypothetical protein OSSY52_06230 [Tepiditoga spiralis]|uniref:histidine kinase n=1 Tax=Tepiditoga spiralis TaxID=2108365 RepID=A0A7G1G8V1_9BACT|nr:HAMP domain-containing sensor histidine kinase [Tepiditoga spiralis]BBE30482.1 hypothetical protein OSSY52_06230 [Tepiditoga spiralis]